MTYLKNMTFKAGVVTLLAALMCALTFLFIFPVSNAQADQVSDLQAQADEVKAQLDEISAEAEVVAGEYREALEKRDAATDAIEEAQDTISSCQDEIEELQETLSERASAMYRSGMGSYIEILFGADSFMDLINAWNMLNSINEKDAATISDIKDLKAEAAQATKDLAEQEKELTKQVKVVEEKKAEIDGKVAEVQAIYDGLDAEIQSLVTAAYLAQQDADNGGGSSSSYGGGHYGSGGTVLSGAAGVAATCLGAAYDIGGSGPDTFDCSGLVQYCYAQCGVYLPHNSESMYWCAAEIIPVSEAQPGDVLYMPGHVGISTGGSSAIEAMDYGYGVCTSNSGKWTCALRF